MHRNIEQYSPPYHDRIYQPLPLLPIELTGPGLRHKVKARTAHRNPVPLTTKLLTRPAAVYTAPRKTRHPKGQGLGLPGKSSIAENPAFTACLLIKIDNFAMAYFTIDPMHRKLIAYMNQHILSALTNEEEALVTEIFKPKKLRRKQYFLQEGEVCKYIAFIVKGALRQYSIDDKGTEHIVHLYIENYWAADRESSIMLTPSMYNIDAWEDTELLFATRAEMLYVVQKIPSLTDMIRIMDERNAIANQRRLNSTISNSAEKRYEEFANNHPQFIQRFPQHVIASYLGITKETLSRIRKQVTK